MVNRKEFFYRSTDGVTHIHAVRWQGAEPPVGVFQIAHGMGEHALRYEPLAEALAERGLLVVANDHIGHGTSVAEGAARLYFGPEKGWLHAVDDMRTLQSLIRREYPGLPYCLLGHSMGSFLARTFLIRYPGAVQAAVIMGTAQMNPKALALGKALAEREGRRLGPDRVSPALLKLTTGPYNKPFAPNRTGSDWLSANAANVDAFLADPLCGGEPTVGLIRDMLGGLSLICKEKNVRRMDKSTPILFVSGAEDPVGGFGKGVAQAYLSFIRSGVLDAELKLYPGMRHEILHESPRPQADICAWLGKHMGLLPR